MKAALALTLSATLLFSGCSGNSKSVDPTNEIKINQVGYRTFASKLAIIPATDATEFKVIDLSDKSVALSGTLTASETWDLLGDEQFKRADFSRLNKPGSYIIEVEGLSPSNSFKIGEGLYEEANKAALKAFYYNRSSMELTKEFAGKFARPEGHPDTQAKIHASAASPARPEGSTFASPKGWYDAGDFGKYIVNSGISTYTMMAAYEHNPSYYKAMSVHIPESSNDVPDLLDEIMWNLDWMLTMHDPSDGGVYHKLTTLNFSGAIMPHEGTNQRYFIGKGTAATLDFAAVMAVAARVYAKYDSAFPGKVAQFRRAAESAWVWAQQNPEVEYIQPKDVQTGAYGDKQFKDERAWAAAELYILTKDKKYLKAFEKEDVRAQTFGWTDVSTLPFISLANKGKDLLSEAQYKAVTDSILAGADSMLKIYQDNPYRVAMAKNHYVWGSNSTALNNAWLLLEGYKISGKRAYLDAATANIDYILGRNPTGYSFVTGIGHKPPMDVHHRASYADDVKDPVPGFLAGGPHSGQQDQCEGYLSDYPAKSYVDHWCSYSANEIAINWNSPLVYLLGTVSTVEIK